MIPNQQIVQQYAHSGIVHECIFLKREKYIRTLHILSQGSANTSPLAKCDLRLVFVNILGFIHQMAFVTTLQVFSKVATDSMQMNK